MNPQPKKKTIRLYGKDRTQFRLKIAKQYHNICQKCGRYAPPYIGGSYSPFRCGDISHIKSVGAGGSDTEDNVEWLCHSCHMKEHNGEFLKGI